MSRKKLVVSEVESIDGYSTRYVYAYGELVESNGRLLYGGSLDCAQDACARTPRTTRAGVLGEYVENPASDGMGTTIS